MSFLRETTYRFDNISEEPNRERVFRLFVLYPGPRDSELEGEIVTYRLKAPNTSSVVINFPEPGEYEALSYNWGPVTKNDPVVNIRDKSQYYQLEKRPPQIRITHNLAEALRNLRYSTYEKRRLWVDALCIDQRNQEEKSLQISCMSIIFGCAEAVRVWLGREDEDSGHAFKFVRRCLANDEFDIAMHDPRNSGDLKALVSLMKKPWFSRRWIVQEIAVARTATLHCGEHSLPWEEFADVISQLSTKQYEIKILFKQSPEFENHADYLGDISELGAIRLVELTYDLFHRTEGYIIRDKNFSLEALMSTMSAFEASVAHDIVYAILWLSKDAVGVALPRRDHDKSVATLLAPDNTRSRALSDQSSRVIQPKRLLTIDASDENDPLSKRRKAEDSPTIRIHDMTALQSLTGVEQSSIHNGPTKPIEFATYGLPSPREADASLPSLPRISTLNGSTTSDMLQPISALNALISAGRKRRITDAGSEREKRQIAFGNWRSAHERRRIYVDYSKSIFEVCREVLEFAMSQREATLDILCRPWAPDDPDDDRFPSWIPRLSNRIAFKPNRRGKYQRVNANPLLGKFEFTGPPYRASHNLTNLINWEFPRDTLRERSLLIDGLVLHTIQPGELKSNATSGTIPADWREAAQWTENLPPDEFWRTLIGNRNSHGRRPPLYWRRACYEAFEEAPKDGDLETSLVLSGNPASSVREFLHRVQEVIWNRRLARITLEHMNVVTPCLVPKATEPGDLICLLYGCNVPVVLHLHQQEERGDAPLYRMLGESYVHGMMDGEANNFRKRLPRPLGHREKRFELV